MSLAGFAPPIWEFGNLLASSGAMAEGWDMGAAVAYAPGDIGCPEQGRMGGSFLGWELRASQKGGDAVGLTRRGKGCKLMVVVDGHGLPLGVLVASARKSEVRLAEPTVSTRHE